MGSRLIVSSVGNNNYASDKNITRAEYAAIVVRALGLATSTVNSNFANVASTDWYCGYVNTAVSYGLITGNTSSTFGPNDYITREQAMVIIAKAMNLTKLVSAANATTILNAYTDSSAISSYAESSVPNVSAMA